MTDTSFDGRVTPARADIAAEHLRGKVDAAKFVRGRTMRVTVPQAWLRRTPEPAGARDTELLYGESFTVYDEADGVAWGQLETDGYVGYVSADALSADTEAATHRITAVRTPVFAGPDIKAEPAALLSMNALIVAGQTDGRLMEARGLGWVFAKHAAPLNAIAPDFVTVAEGFLETPYLWAGRTSLGFDCSALVQNAMAVAGMTVPRDSDMQERGIGAAVDPDGALRRGDLVFWKGHVGIMRDASALLHCNAGFMKTVIEPLADARERIAAAEGDVTSVRRPLALSAS